MQISGRKQNMWREEEEGPQSEHEPRAVMEHEKGMCRGPGIIRTE